MAQIGIAIEKQTAYRDSIQPFANVYHYGSVGLNPGATLAENLLDELVTFEKTIHSSLVTFVKGRVWTSGGSRAENQMLVQKTLSGVGSMSTSASFDKERAYLIQWSAGVDGRGHKVSLRKWYHSCGFFGSHALGAAVMDGTTGFSGTDRTAIANKADGITRIGTVDDWGLVAESGRERDGGPPVAHKYLEHHQLGNQWRG